VIQQLIETGVARLETLNGKVLEEMVNGSRLKLYRDNRHIAIVIWATLKKKGCSSTKVLELAQME
jgi:hypothetical protein